MNLPLFPWVLPQSSAPRLDMSAISRPEVNHVLVVGAGVSGLTAARLLSRAGLSVTVVDARDRIGGRVRTTPEGLDLGPSWLWPSANPRLSTLVEELGLATIRQPVEGSGIHETRAKQLRIPTYDQGSTRLAGGMASLVHALHAELRSDPTVAIRLGRAVRMLRLEGDSVRATFASGDAANVRDVDHVILAAPPRVLAETVRFDPLLPEDTISRWSATPTWMASHAKFVALYETPFWRADGLSGFASSQIGPLAEIHDASPSSTDVPESEGRGALFGFVGLPPHARERMGDARLAEAAIAQLVRLFGPAAGAPLSTRLQDWSAESWTARAGDRAGFGDHPPRQPAVLPPPWSARVSLAGSEFARGIPGYLEGAVEAAERASGSLAPVG